MAASRQAEPRVSSSSSAGSESASVWRTRTTPGRTRTTPGKSDSDLPYAPATCSARGQRQPRHGARAPFVCILPLCLRAPARERESAIFIRNCTPATCTPAVFTTHPPFRHSKPTTARVCYKSKNTLTEEHFDHRGTHDSETESHRKPNHTIHHTHVHFIVVNT